MRGGCEEGIPGVVEGVDVEWEEEVGVDDHGDGGGSVSLGSRYGGKVVTDGFSVLFQSGSKTTLST